MSDKLTAEQVRAFWTRQAIEHGASPTASWSDHCVIEMEVREIARRLHDGDRVLDVGCANGHSTVQYALDKAVTIKGVDYVPEMIAQAKERLAGLTATLKGSVAFEVGNILSLDEPDETYDKLVVVRVLINLNSEAAKAIALRQCARILKPGGLLLLSEATLQGWNRLNALRAEWGLAAIPMPPFNHYVDEERIGGVAPPGLQLLEVVNFASTYYVGTRVLKPLLARALGSAVNAADPDMEWNRWCAQLPPWGDYGTQKLFVLKKLSRENA